MAKSLKCFLLLLCLPPLGAAAQDLRPYFNDNKGCFVLYDRKGDRYMRYNEERCRHSPFSTFKIQNSNIEGSNYLVFRGERINLTKRILAGLGDPPRSVQVAAPKSANSSVRVYQANLELTSYNLLFTSVKIDGQEVRALIDSGSYRAVQLSSTLAQSFKMALTKTGRASKRYEGKEVYPTSGRIERLAVGDYEQRDVVVDVIEGDIENIAAQVGTKFDVILGWGFISQFHTLLDYKRLSMQFSKQPLATGPSAIDLRYSVVNGTPVVRGHIAPSNEETGFLFDTGAPMCNLDLDLANAPKGTKVYKEVTLGERRFTLEFRAKDLTAIRKPLGCAGVIGNNFLTKYAVYFDPDAKVVHLSGR